MNGKISRIEDLLADGWDVEDIASDEARIAVLLRRGARFTTVTLDAEDARDILFGDGLEGARLEPRPMVVER